MNKCSLFYCLDVLVIRLRRFSFFLQRSRYRFTGENILVFGPFSCKAPENISIGSHVSINDYVYINGAGGVSIGNNVSLSAGCKIISTKLDSRDFSSGVRHVSKKITIGNNVHIGAGAIILPGVCICDHVMIGAGAVVSRSIAAPGVYVGIPAKMLFKNI
jgi:maltose O-acetyltransferase